MKQIASLIVKLITNIGDDGVRSQAKEEVSQMCRRFPIPDIDA